VLFGCYNSNPKSNGNVPMNNSFKSNEIIAINYVPFGEKSLIQLTNLYEETANNESVIENFILKSIIQVI
jgi:hypothetical protein